MITLTRDHNKTQDNSKLDAAGKKKVSDNIIMQNFAEMVC